MSIEMVVESELPVFWSQEGSGLGEHGATHHPEGTVTLI